MNLSDFAFGPWATWVAAIAAISALVQFGMFVFLIVILLDLRQFLRKGTSLMESVELWLERSRH